MSFITCALHLHFLSLLLVLTQIMSDSLLTLLESDL